MYVTSNCRYVIRIAFLVPNGFKPTTTVEVIYVDALSRLERRSEKSIFPIATGACFDLPRVRISRKFFESARRFERDLNSTETRRYVRELRPTDRAPVFSAIGLLIDDDEIGA